MCKVKIEHFIHALMSQLTISQKVEGVFKKKKQLKKKNCSKKLQITKKKKKVRKINKRKNPNCRPQPVRPQRV